MPRTGIDLAKLFPDLDGPIAVIDEGGDRANVQMYYTDDEGRIAATTLCVDAMNDTLAKIRRAQNG
jgi:hypothetical protein